MKVAALDLGSNTFLCLIAEVSGDVVTEIYSDEVEIVRLGQDLDKTRKFHPEALQRAGRCLEKFKKTIDLHKPERVLAMATAAARDAENKEELFKIADSLQIPLEIIPGEREASITYQGAISGLRDKNENRLVLDIGGRSTEFIFGAGATLKAAESFNIGCVKLTEKFITAQPTSDEDIERLRQHIDESVLKARDLLPDSFHIHQILAVAGTPTTLAAADLGEFNAEKIDGYVLTHEKLVHWLHLLQPMSVEEKIKQGLPAGRADVILVGVIILLRTLEIFKQSHMIVSTRGVRYGVALEAARR